MARNVPETTQDAQMAKRVVAARKLFLERLEHQQAGAAYASISGTYRGLTRAAWLAVARRTECEINRLGALA